jgi:hypothetical protein
MFRLKPQRQERPQRQNGGVTHGDASGTELSRVIATTRTAWKSPAPPSDYPPRAVRQVERLDPETVKSIKDCLPKA